LQCVAVQCSVCVAVCCNALQRVAGRRILCVLKYVAGRRKLCALHFQSTSMLQGVAVCCSVLQCVAACCSVCVAVRCSVLWDAAYLLRCISNHP